MPLHDDIDVNEFAHRLVRRLILRAAPGFRHLDPGMAGARAADVEVRTVEMERVVADEARAILEEPHV